LQPARRADDGDLRGRARHRLAGREQRDEGDAARPAAVVRPVGLLPGEGDPRAPVPRAEAPARGAARRALTPPGRRAREVRGARLEVRRGGETLQRREEGYRAGGEEARGGAGPAPEPRPLLRLRRGVPTNRDRDRVGVHPVHVAVDVLVLARPRRARCPAHRERLPAALRAALPAPRRGALRIAALLALAFADLKQFSLWNAGGELRDAPCGGRRLTR